MAKDTVHGHGRAILDFVDRKTVLRIGLGFAVAAVMLYLVAVGIGIDKVSEALADAKLRWLALGCLSTMLCLLAWGKAWQIVLEVVGVDVPYRKLVVTYFAATFANYVTPLGQAGGEPFIAYVLASDTDASYEDSLASVVTADLLNLMPFVSFAGIGFAVLILRASVPETIEPLVMALVVLSLGVPVVAAVTWRFRVSLYDFVIRLAAPVTRRTGRLSLASVKNRLHELGKAFERIAEEPRSLAYALVFSYLGWVFFTLPLFFASRALGVEVSVLLVLFIVPASTLAGLVPSPGGSGAVEVALVALLVALSGVTAANALGIAVIYRLASYWFALIVGGAAAMYVIGRN
jgi:hypothetical protein